MHTEHAQSNMWQYIALFVAAHLKTPCRCVLIPVAPEASTTSRLPFPSAGKLHSQWPLHACAIHLHRLEYQELQKQWERRGLVRARTSKKQGRQRRQPQRRGLLHCAAHPGKPAVHLAASILSAARLASTNRPPAVIAAPFTRPVLRRSGAPPAI